MKRRKIDTRASHLLADQWDLGVQYPLCPGKIAGFDGGSELRLLRPRAAGGPQSRSLRQPGWRWHERGVGVAVGGSDISGQLCDRCITITAAATAAVATATATVAASSSSSCVWRRGERRQLQRRGTIVSEGW